MFLLCPRTFLIVFLAFAIHCAARQLPPFDGKSAYNFLLKQCDFGPREPGSVGHQECQNYLAQTLRAYADQVSTQSFMLAFKTPTGEPRSAQATNIIANFQPNMGERVLLCAHWDTRPWADRDPNPANRSKPILGANDGASGVAVLLEVARILAQNKPTVGVDIILFDGEDVGHEGQERSYARGAAAFAAQADPQYRPRLGILLDMVGDTDLAIYKEANSTQYAPAIVEKVWNKADELGIGEFIPQTSYAIFDDHIPLLEAGIPCIDLIDFDYPHWHTLQDTPDKCSAASLEKVGRLLVGLIYAE